MYGYLRFFLAFLVLISHVDVRIKGLNPGVIAVVIFYLLAGQVVRHLWDDILPQSGGRLMPFYRDRLLRIYPLYLFVALLTLLFVGLTGFGHPRFSLTILGYNFTIIPLNYYMILDSTLLTAPAWSIIPPAWSLGAELQAYLLLPFAFMYRSLGLFLAIGSFVVYMLANLSILQPDHFGYRLIPGVFFIFITGSTMKKSRRSPTAQDAIFTLCPWIVWGTIAGAGILFHASNLFSEAYTRETFLGLGLGIPTIFLCSKLPWTLPGNALMGTLSYGIFLGHFLMIWILAYWHLLPKGHALYIPAVTAGSVIIAMAGWLLVEKPVDAIRKKSV